MKYKRSSVLSIIVLSILPVILAGLIYTSLPEMIPTSWGFNGEVEYSEKSTIWLITALSPVIAVFMVFLPFFDPKKENYARFSGAYESFLIMMLVFLLLLDCIIFTEALRPGSFNVSKLVYAMLGLMFVFIGNIMPKVKQNYFFGARTPWSLSNPMVFRRTNRLSGFLLFIGGAMISLSAFFLSEKAMFCLIIAFVLILSVSISVMSYIWFKKETN